MLRQAVQTLTGRADAQAEEPLEDIYLQDSGARRTETHADQDGSQDEPAGNSDLRATVDRLSQGFSTLEQRLSEKDRYIGQLEGENRTLRAGVANPAAGREPTQAPDPVLDKETAALFASKYAENPEEALVALAEHLDRRTTSRTEQAQAQRDLVQQYATKLQAIERNILRQVDLAMGTYGEAAADVVADFVGLVRNGNASPEQYARTWLGSQLGSDRALAETTQGVYRLIELEVLKRQGNTNVETEAQVPAPRAPQTTAISRPSAPSRDVTAPSAGLDEVPVEDRIGDAIVNAARGDDAAIEQLFRG